MAGTTFEELLVTHLGALRRKYGAAGPTRSGHALDALVAADEGAGCVSRVLLLDNTPAHAAVKAPQGGRRRLGGHAPGGRPRDDQVRAGVRRAGRRDRRRAAGARCTTRSPRGSDPDPYVPSDLPFACDLPDTWTGPHGRRCSRPPTCWRSPGWSAGSPTCVGATDPAMLLAALDTAATYTQRTATAYQKVFALTGRRVEGLDGAERRPAARAGADDAPLAPGDGRRGPRPSWLR